MLSQGHRTPTTLWEHSYTSGTLLGPNWLRGPWPFLLYKVLYSVHASPRAPCVAIQLYSAIQRYTALYSYTAIHRYTLYMLYNTPLVDLKHKGRVRAEHAYWRISRGSAALDRAGAGSWQIADGGATRKAAAGGTSVGDYLAIIEFTSSSSPSSKG